VLENVNVQDRDNDTEAQCELLRVLSVICGSLVGEQLLLKGLLDLAGGCREPLSKSRGSKRKNSEIRRC
jgi:hypothetical protein